MTAIAFSIAVRRFVSHSITVTMALAVFATGNRGHRCRRLFLLTVVGVSADSGIPG